MMTQLRLQGVERVEDVKASYLEGTGEVSVIKREESDEEWPAVVSGRQVTLR